MTGFPLNATEAEIKAIIESFGQIKYFYLAKNNESDNKEEATNKGYCFFEYISNLVTERALKGLNNLTMNDRHLKVQRANAYNNKEYTILNEIKKNIKKEEEEGGTYKNILKELDNKGFSDKKEVTFNELIVPNYATVPSRVLQFINMLTPEDLMDDIECNEIINDIKTECLLYGTVLNVEIPRPDKDTMLAGEAVGKVFVKFSSCESAKKARSQLSGRLFNGRTAIASFYPEAYFDVREFCYKESI